MYAIQQTNVFVHWSSGLRDVRAKAAIIRRLDRAHAGNLGDVKAVGDGVSEMRVDIGPGYRLHFTRPERVLILLLCGGVKSTQAKDIKAVQKLAKECST